MTKKGFGVKTIVAIGIGAAIYFLLAKFLVVPIFANTSLAFQYAVNGFFATVFGPIAGTLIAFIGHTLADLLAAVHPGGLGLQHQLLPALQQAC